MGLRLPESGTEIVIHTEPEGMEVDLPVTSVSEAVATVEQAGGRVVVPPFQIQIGMCAVVEDPFGNRLVLLDMSTGRLVSDEAGNAVVTSVQTTQRRRDGLEDQRGGE